MNEAAAREAEVRAAIAQVRDPEIDETVAALNFIVAVRVDGGDVAVTLRLPTFWCPANFVFLLGGDIRHSVSSWSIISPLTKSAAVSLKGAPSPRPFHAKPRRISATCADLSTEKLSSCGRRR